MNPRKTLTKMKVGIFIIILIFIFGFAFDFVFIIKPIQFVGRPILHACYSLSQWMVSIPKPFTDKSQLVSDIEKLETEKIKLLEENSILRGIVESDRVQEKIDAFLISIEQQAVSAQVIGKSTSTQQLLLIDKGEAHGIKIGYSVITGDGILVGTIYSVTPLTSQVLLVTDSTQSIGAKIQNEQSSPGIVKGSYGLSLIIDLVPQDDILEEGQSVVTSAINPLIPPDLLIGTVSRTAKKEGGVFQEAQLVSPIQLERVENVSVIIPRNANS